MLHRLVHFIEWLECDVVCSAMGVSYNAASFSSFYRVVGVWCGVRCGVRCGAVGGMRLTRESN